MLKNESNLDRLIRLIVGLILAAYSYLNLSAGLQIAGYFVAAVLIFTALTGFCLIYKVLNISTVKNPSVDTEESDEAETETDESEDDE